VPPRQTKRVLVIGGSMSGLFASLMLRQRGFVVDVCERVESELAGRGAGIVAQPVVSEMLRRLGLDTRELGVEATRRVVLDQDGDVVCRS
jgi:2-polyprenyl-6-methoxyphenol hydroxylase-like FAD-dependent oxidoreductase